MEQAVILTFDFSREHRGTRPDLETLQDLGDELGKQVKRARVGEFDGDEFGEDDFQMFFYGPSADQLFDVVKAGLKQFKCSVPVTAVKRYGAPGATEHREELRLGA